ncbi:hypothetical protein [Synechococcus sp. CBW1002]|uniref:hypothetical protein n=1 Tax=Synechococcus sp. CBW1002 TaxID=1353134 RepID=UPI0018CEA17F|nr:hypothetical protein [Synechococcus sp. CBW1002]
MAHRVLTEIAVSISAHKKNPMATVAAGDGMAVAVLNRNEPAFYCGTPEKDSRPIGAGFVRLLRVNQAGKRGDIKSARSQKHGLQMPSGALIADQAIKKL